jgi:hypothetical protein
MLRFFTKKKAFLVDTANDERIPSRDKKVLLAMVALLISPFDIIPDWIPFFGVLDDVIILSLIMDYFFSVLDSKIILSHFPWDMKAYSRLKRMATLMQSFVPKFLKKKLWAYIGDPY